MLLALQCVAHTSSKETKASHMVLACVRQLCSQTALLDWWTLGTCAALACVCQPRAVRLEREPGNVGC